MSSDSRTVLHNLLNAKAYEFLWLSGRVSNWCMKDHGFNSHLELSLFPRSSSPHNCFYISFIYCSPFITKLKLFVQYHIYSLYLLANKSKVFYGIPPEPELGVVIEDPENEDEDDKDKPKVTKLKMTVAVKTPEEMRVMIIVK